MGSVLVGARCTGEEEKACKVKGRDLSDGFSHKPRDVGGHQKLEEVGRMLL